MGKINSSYYRDEEGINEHKDTRVNREKWFKYGLHVLDQWCVEGNIKSVAFPYTIGWGLVGGNWKTYLGMIKEFQKTYTNVSDVFYKLSG